LESTRKLAQLDAAHTLEFLRSPPGNRLEALRGSRAGRHSIRVTDQFRLCFRWTAAGAEDVEIVDYHLRRTAMIKNGMRPVHPGEILREDCLVPLGTSANALAKALNVPAPRINDIVRERRGVSADTAMRLARYFGGVRDWGDSPDSGPKGCAKEPNSTAANRENGEASDQ
jgi:addiction module HigA family antidote